MLDKSIIICVFWIAVVALFLLLLVNLNTSNKGEVYNFKVFNKALTEDEVKDLYSKPDPYETITLNSPYITFKLWKDTLKIHLPKPMIVIIDTIYIHIDGVKPEPMTNKQLRLKFGNTRFYGKVEFMDSVVYMKGCEHEPTR